ncbi:unnamed protein product [Parnassius mnemosyne]|uniref:unspecific monooxygenase n=1 Tax=Parnassius mnemosyne TaxID=213953 RepID=A0AAV1KCB8_9NEOP
MITVIIAIITILSLYVYGTRTYKYWEQRGIKHDKPLPFLGNNARNFLMLSSPTEITVEMYWKYPNEKVIGFYRAFRPELVVRDPEIVKRVLTTDFIHFYPRGINSHKKVIEPMLRNLFHVDGDVWRLLRQRMTPAFTSGKLKAMFPLIVERAEKLQTRVLDAASSGRILDARELLARYTTDFIGACGFGLQTDSLNDENSAFRQLGAKMFAPTAMQLIIGMLKLMFPETFKYAKTQGEVETDIVALLKEIMKQRNYQPSGRNDFIDLLLECKAKGTIVGESIEHFKPDGTPEIAKLELDDLLMAAQVFVFFAAGFETSSSATSYTLLQFAYNPGVQKKVQSEIDRVLAKHNNKLSYEAIKEMTYLECAFKEGMRMFPSLGFLIRQCVSKYTIPEIDLTIDPGVQILIPVQAMQNDPQYFANPEQFQPERFLHDEYDSNNKYVYLPFGLGPRACIGERLGLMQSLAGLAAVLSCCSVEPGPTTIRNPKIDPKSRIVQTIKGGIPLVFRKRHVKN